VTIDWRLYVRTHLPPLDIPAEREAEIREELAQQLEAVYAAARASGSSVDEAIARATAEIEDWQHLAASLCHIESRARWQDPPLDFPSRGAVMYGFLLDVRRAARRLLHATPPQIWRMVMTRGLQLVAAGVVIGIAAVFVFGRAIEAQLFGIPAANMPTLAGAAGALISAAGVACIAPALRATRVNPVDSLRAE
jgi:hypothetical protein